MSRAELRRNKSQQLQIVPSSAVVNEAYQTLGNDSKNRGIVGANPILSNLQAARHEAGNNPDHYIREPRISVSNS